MQYSQWQAVVWSFASTIVVLQSIALELLYASKKRLFCDLSLRALPSPRNWSGVGAKIRQASSSLSQAKLRLCHLFAVAARAAAACLE